MGGCHKVCGRPAVFDEGCKQSRRVPERVIVILATGADRIPHKLTLNCDICELDRWVLRLNTRRQVIIEAGELGEYTRGHLECYLRSNRCGGFDAVRLYGFLDNLNAVVTVDT